MLFTKDSLAGLMVACVLLLGVSHVKGRFKLRLYKILEARPLKFLGSISYSLYLLHAAVLMICLWTAERFQLNNLQSFWLRNPRHNLIIRVSSDFIPLF